MKCWLCDGTGIDPQAVDDDGNIISFIDDCPECYCGEVSFWKWLQQRIDFILWRLGLKE